MSTRPSTYRKRPIVIEAMQWTGDNIHDLQDWITAESLHGPVAAELARLYVAANDVWLNIEIGEWVLRDAHGFYPCKSDIFAATYEAVGGEAAASLTGVHRPDRPSDLAGEVERLRGEADQWRRVAVTLDEDIEQLRVEIISHSDPCTTHPDGGPIECGWKRAMIRLRALLSDAPTQPAPERRTLCPSCGGLDGAHGLMHIDGGNVPCPEREGEGRAKACDASGQFHGQRCIRLGEHDGVHRDADGFVWPNTHPAPTPDLRERMARAIHAQPLTGDDLSMPLADGTQRIVTPAARRIADDLLAVLAEREASHNLSRHPQDHPAPTPDLRERAVTAAQRANESNVRLLVLATGVTLDQFAAQHPDIARALAATATDAVLAVLTGQETSHNLSRHPHNAASAEWCDACPAPEIVREVEE
jgi:hypothetical protein